MTRWIEVARVLVVAAACFAAMASASSSQNSTISQGAYNNSPPPPQAMPSSAALGLWMSSFGAVKIEEDLSRGAAGAGHIHGAWTYQDRNTQREVVGYFSGSLRGNVLEFRWHEPATPAPLVGSGYLAFDPMGRSFRGRWRTDTGDRVGDWDGWRQNSSSQPYPNTQQQPYPNQPYPAQPYPNQPYPNQPYPAQPYPNQPYPAQPQPQPYPGGGQQPYSQPPPPPYGRPAQPQPAYPNQQPYSPPPPPAQPRYY